MPLMLIDKDALNDFKAEIELCSKMGAQASSSPISAETMTVSNGVAAIKISGPILPKRSEMLSRWGVEHAGYAEIISDVMAADADGRVKEVEYHVTSPGGYVDGMYEAMRAMQSLSKPSKAIVGTMAASAAYMLASQAGSIVAKSPMSLVGSVGVVRSYYLSDYAVDVTNTASDKKRPDVSTEKGLDDARAELDDIYSVVVAEIAKGRNTTVETINKNYGQGATMTAKKALAAGMIDMIDNSAMSTDGGKKPQITGSKIAMTLQELKAQNPALYDEIFALGEKTERARVQGHLELGAASEDMERAHADIAAGNPIDSLVTAHHTAEGIKRAKLQALVADGQTAETAHGDDPQEQANETSAIDKQRDEIIAAVRDAGGEVEYYDYNS